MSLPDPSDFAPIPPEREQRWIASLNAEAHHAWLGLRFEEIRLDYARARIPFRPELLQGAGVVHGGVFSTLLDTVAVGAVFSAHDQRPARSGTVSQHMQFLGPVREGDLLAVAKVRRRGRTIVFLEAVAVDSAGTPVAHADLTYLAAS